LRPRRLQARRPPAHGESVTTSLARHRCQTSTVSQGCSNPERPSFLHPLEARRAHRVPASRSAVCTTHFRGGRDVRILVVEDEPCARRVLRRILVREGHEVRAAASGRAAMKHVTTFNPEVVITDWRLPGMTGEQLCREIRRRRPTVPIIIASSDDDAFTSPVDVDVRLRKPIDLGRLCEVLEAACSSRQADRVSGTSQRSRLSRHRL
jgi:CheY-like chemotaxis protein